MTCNEKNLSDIVKYVSCNDDSVKKTLGSVIVIPKKSRKARGAARFFKLLKSVKPYIQMDETPCGSDDEQQT